MFKKLLKILLIVLSLVCFYVVYLMYSKLSFIDTPYLYVGLVLMSVGFFLHFKK